MDAHLLKLIVFLVIGVVAMLNRLVRKGADGGGGTAGKGMPPFPRGNMPQRPSPVSESEEERLRRFREALGIPTLVEPPKKIVRPPPQVPPVMPPYKKPVPKPMPRQVPPPTPAVTAFPAPNLAPSAPWEVPVVTVTSSPMMGGQTGAGTSAAADMTQFRALLKSPESLRTAVILREVLGPPKALQTSASVPGLA